MTFGEKLQALRKSRGLSQEQLAEVLEVSRQAVSKWELNASMPDADKIVEISCCFSVSTDYLLKDELEKETAAPTVGAADWAGRKTNEDARRRAALVGCLGAMALGMLFSISLTCLAGYPFMLASCLVFEILLSRESGEQRRRQRYRFYRVAVWLLTVPVVYLLLYFWWYLRIWQFPAAAAALLAVCTVISFLCHKKSKTGK